MNLQDVDIAISNFQQEETEPRHKPAAAGIQLDEHGWAKVNELIDGVNSIGRRIDMGSLESIVATDEKGRYRFNEDKTLTRANQGHSVVVDVELKEQEPP